MPPCLVGRTGPEELISCVALTKVASVLVASQRTEGITLTVQLLWEGSWEVYGVDFPFSPQRLAGIAGSCGQGASIPQPTCTCAALKEQDEPCGLEGLSEVELGKLRTVLTTNNSHGLLAAGTPLLVFVLNQIFIYLFILHIIDYLNIQAF